MEKKRETTLGRVGEISLHFRDTLETLLESRISLNPKPLNPKP